MELSSSITVVPPTQQSSPSPPPPSPLPTPLATPSSSLPSSSSLFSSSTDDDEFIIKTKQLSINGQEFRLTQSSSSLLSNTQQQQQQGSSLSIENYFTKIIDKLYLTSAKYMIDEHLINHGITHIVNATRTVPLKRNYRTCRVNIVDSTYENIGAHFDSVGEFIHKALENEDGIVAVHCISGISRSSTLVIAYLMKYKNMSLKVAFDFVRSKRWFIRPNTGFFQQLIDYELKLYGTNTVKMIYHETGGYIPDFILAENTKYKYFYLCIKK
ncbi:Dual specificity protein phosphatase 14 [Dermatophagoides farinae]|uniref:Dual specificity protein phosphatase 14 n=1 Tax=Dermatophagoides farinae TaxID=6954 RepID=A0A922L7S8_DERFA|nr:Dual specificity protein phosphatase 14 [Dermatophagoides farinae]